VASTYAAFQSRLSVGDVVQGYYNSPNQSTFSLTDSKPMPGTVTATASTAASGGVDLTVVPSTGTDVTSYKVYRATAVASSPATGAPTTCAANPGTPFLMVAPSTGGAWTSIGTVLSTATLNGGGNYTFTDATPAPATGTAPYYCYLVSAVAPNAIGGSQEGTGAAPSQNANTPSAGIQPAPVATAAAAPKFVTNPTNAATRTLNSWAITAVYNQKITAASVDAGDFTVVYTDSNGTSYPLTVTAEAGNNGAVGYATMTANTAATVVGTGGHVVVTAKAGTDLNTVGGQTTPVLYQPVGDSLFITTT
jgi:hypothetical protein